MAYASRAGRARTSPSNPQAHALCDRCGFRWNHSDLQWQYDYRGTALANIRLLVCNRCLDTPNDQLRAVVVPADPVPIIQPRIQDFYNAETSTRYTLGNTVNAVTGIPVPNGDVRITQADDDRVVQQTGEPPGGLNQEPGTDADAPGNDDPGLPYGYTDVPKTGPA